jgi:hypothetical protein
LDAISWIVLSPRKASIATRALKSPVKRRLVVIGDVPNSVENAEAGVAV